ncbi:MAG: PhnD/SsuA/transferrin family substrate-binding protein [Burkholderiales bacterium]|nr:PhnD/SsuA/transferrin family substrate-binding protein [Burkholderiales bacterium]
MPVLRFTSCQAQSADFACREIAEYLGRRIGSATGFIADIPWQQRERMLDAGRIHVAWICGLPYVRKSGRIDNPLELLGAPVMLGARYQGRPVYFSDVLVHRDSAFRCFEDLRGASRAYNEPGSHSGYNAVRYHLATLGERRGYFGEVIESGAHQTSLQWLLDRKVDASAIDSAVLEFACQRDPGLREQLRRVATFGPAAIPPWVVLKSVVQRDRLRDAMLAMHETSEGRALCASRRSQLRPHPKNGCRRGRRRTCRSAGCHGDLKGDDVVDQESAEPRRRKKNRRWRRG